MHSARSAHCRTGEEATPVSRPTATVSGPNSNWLSVPASGRRRRSPRASPSRIPDPPPGPVVLLTASVAIDPGQSTCRSTKSSKRLCPIAVLIAAAALRRMMKSMSSSRKRSPSSPFAENSFPSGEVHLPMVARERGAVAMDLAGNSMLAIGNSRRKGHDAGAFGAAPAWLADCQR